MSANFTQLKTFCIGSVLTISAIAYGHADAQNASPAATQAATATATTTTAPQAGNWEISVTMKGAPSGDEKSTRKVCITPSQVSAGFEQTVFDNLSSSKGTLKCSLKDIKRDGTKATWPASCEGPRGPIQGSGSGTIEASSADLAQILEMKTPFGTMKLQQIVSAKRQGDC